VIRFELVQDIEKAKHWWNFFSANETLYATWDFRYAYYKYTKYPLYFYVAFLHDEPIGLLPLQYNSSKKYLEFFGGSAMENNQVLYKPGNEFCIELLYKQIDQPAKLEYIKGEDSFTKQLPFADFKYILDLKQFTSSNEFLEKYFSTRTQKKIRSILDEFQQQDIQVLKNNAEDLEFLFQWNIAHFKRKSAFHKPYRKEIFKDLLSGPWEPHVYTFLYNGNKTLVCYALLYKGIYLALNSGMAEDAPKDFQTYYHFSKIQFALNTGAHIYDAQSGNCGWKEKWHFSPIPQYKFIYPPESIEV